MVYNESSKEVAEQKSFDILLANSLLKTVNKKMKVFNASSC